MASAYTGLDVLIDNGDGTVTPVPNVTVKARDVSDADPATGAGAVELPDLLSDADGHVGAGEFDIAAGSTVRFFWVRDLDGRCGSALQVTTAP